MLDVMLTIASRHAGMFLKISRAVHDIRLCNFGPNWAHISPKGDFFGKIIYASFVYLLCLIMPQKFKKFLREWIIRHKVVQFWPKLGPNCP